MQRIHTLIDKLYQQKEQQASPAHLLFTVQLLQQELTQLQSSAGTYGSKRVSVTLPMNINFSQEALRTPFNEAGKEKEIFVLDSVEETADEDEPLAAPLIEAKEYLLRRPVMQEPVYAEPIAKKIEEPKPLHAHPGFNPAFEVVAEAPTLTQYATRKEVNHSMAEANESLNDKLKEERTEVAHRLKDAPIKDLKKAIGINDRFLFVKELFRGDDAAYERSIKTINGFHIYSEAEYWMARELRLKLAWTDTNETVKHFYGLVKRRFS